MARGQTPPHQVRVITRVVLTQKTNVGIQASSSPDYKYGSSIHWNLRFPFLREWTPVV